MAFDKIKYKAQLKTLGIGQSGLANILKVDIRTVSRWLSQNYSLKNDKVAELCEAIGVDPIEYDPEWIGSPNNRNKARVSANISSASKNGYWLLKKRYGVSEKDLVELAPIMFAVIVENTRLIPHIWWENWERLVAHSRELNMPEPYDIGHGHEYANNCIDALNDDKIFGRKQDEVEFDPTRPGNLFLTALQQLVENSSNIHINASHVLEGCPDAKGSIIDKAYLDAITGGSSKLNEAISRGDIELYGEKFESFPTNSERIEWMADLCDQIETEQKKSRTAWMDKLKVTNPELYMQMQRLTKRTEEMRTRNTKRINIKRRRKRTTADHES